MKLRNILYYLALIVLLTPLLWATNTNPKVTNVTFSISGTTVTVHYDVTDAEQSSVIISMEVSSDGGATWNYNFGAATGDIDKTPLGTNKTITWTYSGGYNNQFQIKIIADDLVGDQIYYAGKIYNTVTIGSQVWLKENLDIGTQINGSLEQTNNRVIEKYCYNDDPNNCTTYGGLYQWAEAVAYTNGVPNISSPSSAFAANIQGICPTGWHLPTYAEYTTLSSTVSGNSNALKAVGQGTGGGAGTNTSGFSALLAGVRVFYVPYFYDLGHNTTFWSSTEYDATNAYFMALNSSNSNIGFDFYYKDSGYSVRCAKN